MEKKTYISFKEIHSQQKFSLDFKIVTARLAIQEAFKVCKSRSAIAFSGGKDSAVLMHIIKKYFPEEFANTAIIFGNTGNEYPESLKFARELGKEWGGDNFYEAKPGRLAKDELKYEARQQVLEYLIETGQVGEILKKDGKLKSEKALERACPPEMRERFYKEGLIWKAGTPKSYWWCADQYGFPILGKEFSKLNAQRINIDCFLRFSKSESVKEETLKYYDILRQVKISQACCTILKKNPSSKLEKDLKIDLSFVGLMASESYRRKKLFASRGYLYEVTTKFKFNNIPFYHCNPLSIWTDADIWEYIHRFDVPYAPLYDLTYTDEKGNTCKMKRNGCIGCFTDYGRKNSHMYVLRQTHPERWKAVMKYGMAKEIQKLRTAGNKKYAKQSILDALVGADETYDETIAWAIKNRPCAFD